MTTPARNNSPVGQLDSQGRVNPNSFGNQAFKGDYGMSGSNLIYRGLAQPGSDTSAAVWQISLFTYDGSNNLLSITWPQNTFGAASSLYNFIWDDRAGYTYS